MNRKEKFGWFVIVLGYIIGLSLLIRIADFAIGYIKCIYDSFPLLGEHHLSKDTLFSSFVAVLCSIPGLLCGALALWQTKRNYELEDRYHHPMMVVQSLEWEPGVVPEYADFDNSQYTREELLLFRRWRELGWRYIIRCTISFSVKNGIGIDAIGISSIRFLFSDSNCVFDLQIGNVEKNFGILKHNYDNGNIIYQYEFLLNPYRGEVSEREFAENVQRFNEHYPVFLYPDVSGKRDGNILDLEMEWNIKYEFGDNSEDRQKLKARLDSQKRNLKNNILSENGVFLHIK